MNENKDRWTPEDEARFVELARKRERIQGLMRSAVLNVALKLTEKPTFAPPLPGTTPTMPQSEADRLTDRMIANADALRDALQPYDSGVRPAQANGG